MIIVRCFGGLLLLKENVSSTVIVIVAACESLLLPRSGRRRHVEDVGDEHRELFFLRLRRSGETDSPYANLFLGLACRRSLEQINNIFSMIYP